MLIHKLYKNTGKETLLTVDQFLVDVKETFGDTTKHKQLMSLAALIDGRFCQDLEVAYYIKEAISKFTRERLEQGR